MKKLTFIVTLLFSVIIFSAIEISAAEIKEINVDLFGRLNDHQVRSTIDQVSVYYVDESLDIYFHINLESVVVELENQDTGEIVYTHRINTYSVKNITIDLADLEEGAYRIQFTNLQSGDTMYGEFRTGI